jgi:P27 family predicted phage terminase small subunit
MSASHSLSDRCRLPRHLSREAKGEWTRLAQPLYDRGLLTDVDRGALAAVCQAYGRWVKAERMVTKRGMTTFSAHGSEIPSAHVRIARQAMDDYVRLASEFGLTPSSRSRVTTSGDEQLPLAEVLFGVATRKRERTR